MQSSVASISIAVFLMLIGIAIMVVGARNANELLNEEPQDVRSYKDVTEYDENGTVIMEDKSITVEDDLSGMDSAWHTPGIDVNVAIFFMGVLLTIVFGILAVKVSE